jgi:pyruvate/2-oxoacid:ferredoxin oxidoreductase beta subunit
LPAPVLPQPTWQEALLELLGRDVAHCAGCGATTYCRVIPMALTFQRRPRRPP